MRLLFVHSHRFLTDGSGGVFSDGKFSAEILNRYLQVFSHVTVAGRQRVVEGEIELSRVETESIRFVPLGDVKTRLDLRNLRTLQRRLRRAMQDADAVIARVPSLHGEVAAELAWRMKKPFGLEVVGDPRASLWYHGSLWGKLLAPMAWWRMRSVVRKSRCTLYVTSNYLQKAYPASGFSIACSNVHLCELDPRLLVERTARLQRRSAKRFGMIATLQTRYKGIDVAIRALRLLRARGVDCQLQIVGEGDPEPWRRFARRAGVDESVKFLGSMRHEDVISWLDSLDVYLHPSLTEGLPRGLLEAMSRGCPALGSDAGGIPEVLAAEYIHPAGDWRRLAYQAEELLAEVDRMTAASQVNLEVAREYSLERLNERRKVFYSRIAAEVSS